MFIPTWTALASSPTRGEGARCVTMQFLAYLAQTARHFYSAENRCYVFRRWCSFWKLQNGKLQSPRCTSLYPHWSVFNTPKMFKGLNRHKKRTFNDTGVYKRKLSLLLSSSNEAFKNSKPDQIIDGFGFGRFFKHINVPFWSRSSLTFLRETRKQTCRNQLTKPSNHRFVKVLK